MFFMREICATFFLKSDTKVTQNWQKVTQNPKIAKNWKNKITKILTKSGTCVTF
jgi:hypothetical protein